MAISTNLAVRPFRNERLPWLLASVLLASAIVATIVHAQVVSRLLSGKEADTVRVARQNEDRIAQMEQRIAAEPPVKVEAAELARLRALEQLVDQRVFPWRRLLANLEDTLSDDVRLTSIAPAILKSGRDVSIQLAGQARTKDDAFSFAERLDASAAFSGAVLKSLAEGDGTTKFNIEVLFDSNAQAPLSSSATDGKPAIPSGSKANTSPEVVR